MTVKVSIVLPTYNQAHYLPEAMDGVFAQTYPHYELIVVNDGSTDDTAAVLADYQERHDFTLVEQENQGLPRALNAGFDRARGEYFTWTSSDNIMLPEMLGILVQALNENRDVGLVYADFFLMGEDGRDLGRFRTAEYAPHWLTYGNLVHCCFLYRRECMARVGGYDPGFIYNEDWEYWIRISRYYRMRRVPHSLYRYRLHSNSMTSEIERGTARKINHTEFATRLRRRMPVRWRVHRLKRSLARLSSAGYPVGVHDNPGGDIT